MRETGGTDQLPGSTAKSRRSGERANEDTLCYYGNKGSSGPIHLKAAGIYGLSNSLLETQWRKQLFTSIVNKTLRSDGLVQELLHILNNEELNTPTPHRRVKVWASVRPYSEPCLVCVCAHQDTAQGPIQSSSSTERET